MHPSLERKLELVDNLYFTGGYSLDKAVAQAEQVFSSDDSEISQHPLKKSQKIMDDRTRAKANIVAKLLEKWPDMKLQEAVAQVDSLMTFLYNKLPYQEAIKQGEFMLGMRDGGAGKRWQRYEREIDYLNALARNAEFDSYQQRQERRIQERGYASSAAYQRALRKKKTEIKKREELLNK